MYMIASAKGVKGEKQKYEAAFVMNPVMVNVNDENPVSCNSSNLPFGLVLIDTAEVSVMSDCAMFPVASGKVPPLK